MACVSACGESHSRAVELDVTAAEAFVPIARIGGTTGWYYANALWRVRGLVDLVAGGVGLRRGRRHPGQLRPGDSLDFWRVEAFEPNRLLRLHAEMRLPGRAWLQFEVTGDGPVVLRQTATFGSDWTIRTVVLVRASIQSTRSCSRAC